MICEIFDFIIISMDIIHNIHDGEVIKLFNDTSDVVLSKCLIYISENSGVK